MTTFAKSAGYLAFSGLLLLLLAGCDRPLKLQPIPPGASVVALGNSVTFGTGAPTGEDWPTRLAQKTGWQITNAGVPGDTAEQAPPEPLINSLSIALPFEPASKQLLLESPSLEARAEALMAVLEIDTAIDPDDGGPSFMQ